MLFPGYQLSADSKQALNQYVPQLQGLQNARVVVYGYTDNMPVGPALQRPGLATTSICPTNIAKVPAGSPASEVAWPGRAPLLEAIEHWDPRLWERLDRITASPRTPGKPREGPRYPLLPEDNFPPNEKHEHRAWIEAVELLKNKTKSGGEYIRRVLEIGEPSNQPETASDEWIETILPTEVSFANSQILRNQRVFAVWVSQRVATPERPPRTVDKGGRPAKFRWDEFWFEVCRNANTPDGLPDQRRVQQTDDRLGFTALERSSRRQYDKGQTCRVISSTRAPLKRQRASPIHEFSAVLSGYRQA